MYRLPLTGPKERAVCSGRVLVEDHERFVVLRYGDRDPAVRLRDGAWVSGVVATGVITALAITSTVPMIAAGVVLGAARIVGEWRDEHRAGPATPIAVIDLSRGLLLDGDGRVLAPLADVRFFRDDRPRNLMCDWPGGELLLLQASTFGGPVSHAVEAMESRGIGVARFRPLPRTPA